MTGRISAGQQTLPNLCSAAVKGLHGLLSPNKVAGALYQAKNSVQCCSTVAIPDNCALHESQLIVIKHSGGRACSFLSIRMQ